MRYLSAGIVMVFDVKINVDVNATLETIKFNGTADSIKFKYPDSILDLSTANVSIDSNNYLVVNSGTLDSSGYLVIS